MTRSPDAVNARGASGEITRLLQEQREKGRESFDELVPLVYDYLRGGAQRQLRRSKRSETLSTTALVHEAYLHSSPS